MACSTAALTECCSRTCSSGMTARTSSSRIARVCAAKSDAVGGELTEPAEPTVPEVRGLVKSVPGFGKFGEGWVLFLRAGLTLD